MEAAHNDSTVRVQFKVVRKGNERYLIGYCLKDEGFAHGNAFTIGLSADEIKAAIDEYHAKASGWDHSAAKINKTPLKKIEKQVAFKVNNLFILAAWFVAHHGLQPIARALTMPLVVAYALSTQRYRLDDTFVTGRTGASLDRPRTDAFFHLAMTGGSLSVPELVPLVETVLFGSNATTPNPDAPAPIPGVPSTAELVAQYSLERARCLCSSLQEQEQESEKRTGRAVVIDYMNFVESTAVAHTMHDAGLAVSTLFSRTQATPYQCGHNAAGWVCMLRALGLDFQSITHDMVSTLNIAQYPRTQNPRIGKDAEDQTWLLGDEIVALVDLDNPDGPGTHNTWLKGPCPLNFFYTYFAQSLKSSHSVDVNIMVVNTVKDNGVPTNTTIGVHWFVVAWYLDP